MNYLKDKFEQTGKTQTEISVKSGITQSHFYRIINSNRRMSWDLAKRLYKLIRIKSLQQGGIT